MQLIEFRNTVLDKIFLWYEDYDFRRMIGGPSVKPGPEEIKAHYLYKYDGKRGTVIGVEAENGEIIGAFFIEELDSKNKRCYLHVIFDPNKKRHAKRATRLFFDWMFLENEFKQMCCIIPMTNTVAHNFVSKLGFKKKCVIPDYYLLSNGWNHGVFYSLMQKDRKV